MIQIVTMLAALAAAPDSSTPITATRVVTTVLHTYEAKIRLNGKVSTTQVKASDAGHAKKLVQAQYGPSVTVLSVKKLD
jgi:hypothetical protein